METLLSLQTPGGLSALIDQAAMLKRNIARQSNALASLENELKILMDAIGAAMQAEKLLAAAGEVGRAEISRKRVYQMDAQMWPALHKHIRDTGEFDLLTRRINTTAMREREKVGSALPPGVIPVVIDKLEIGDNE
jgi:hypothetical protein